VFELESIDTERKTKRPSKLRRPSELQRPEQRFARYALQHRTYARSSGKSQAEGNH
jgi:hypothetical protein